MKIVKNKRYYYLSHSFRSNNAVIHREKYLGKQIPINIEEIKEEFLRKCNETIFTKLNQIKKNFSKEWRKYPKSIKKKFLIDLSVDYTYNTNAIEGSTITHDETEDLIKRKIAPNKSLRDVQETINHSKVFFEIFNSNKDLSLKLILDWHKKIFLETKPDIAGKIRDYLVRVGDYRAPDWQDLDKLLKEFFSWYKESKKTHPVELAARAHYKFEKIHPFGDGNGRIGRLIIAFILKNNGFPLLIIEYKGRKSYYHALTKDENGFLGYFFRRYLKSYNKLNKN